MGNHFVFTLEDALSNLFSCLMLFVKLIYFESNSLDLVKVFLRPLFLLIASIIVAVLLANRLVVFRKNQILELNIVNTLFVIELCVLN